MADDSAPKQRPDQSDDYWDEEPHHPEQEPGKAAHRYERAPQSEEEWHERIKEAEEHIEEHHGGEKRGEFFTASQIVEEMAVAARKIYGSKNHYVDDDAYFDLVETWLMLPAFMEEDYHEKFLKRVGVRGWESRANIHLIPKKYVLAMHGIDKAVEDGMLYPLKTHKVKYWMYVKFPPFGPPLAYYNFIGPSRHKAHSWGERESSGGVGERELRENTHYQYKARYQTLVDEYKEAAQKYKEAKDAGDTAKAKKYREKGQRYREQIDDLLLEWKRWRQYKEQ